MVLYINNSIGIEKSHKLLKLCGKRGRFVVTSINQSYFLYETFIWNGPACSRPHLRGK